MTDIVAKPQSMSQQRYMSDEVQQLLQTLQKYSSQSV
jgi:hypothetical protein